MLPTPKSNGAESKLLNAVATSRKDVNTQTFPLWNEPKHDTSNLSAFSADYKKSLTSCRNCSNGSCPTCKMRRAITPSSKTSPEDQTHAEADVETSDKSAITILETKGGPGSGYHGPRPKEQDSDWGGSAPRNSPVGTPDINKVARGRVQFQKTKLAKEIVAHAARVKQLDEKPFRGIRDRLEARRHMKAIRQKTKTLDLPEDQVWEVIEQFPPAEQAFLATAAKLDKNNSAAVRVVKNVGKHLARQKIQDLGAKFAPSPLLEPEDVQKLSLKETVAYIAAYDDPSRAAQFVQALQTADFKKMTQLRARAMQNAISNTQRNIRNTHWLDAAAEVRGMIREQETIARQRSRPFRPPTQREFEKMVLEVVQDRSKGRLRQYRSERGEPVVRFGGFGGKT